MPYITMIASAHVSGRARDYGPYKHIAIVEIEPGLKNPPAMISGRARGVRRIVRDSGGLWAGGSTMRSHWNQVVAEYEDQTAHLNRLELYEVAPMVYPIQVAEIEAEANEERKRELLERFRFWKTSQYLTGLEGYLAAVHAVQIHRDDHGTLYRHEPAQGEVVVAVRVVCPSTGRIYLLRVPPTCQTAHEAVAWTFGRDTGDYAPAVAA
ncbi:MAG: DUF6745 domain-containing protein [Chloroflexota bacterium]